MPTYFSAFGPYGCTVPPMRKAVVVLVVVLAACGGGTPMSPPRAALLHQLDLASSRQARKLYPFLVDEQKAMISEDHYAECLAKQDRPAVTFKVLESYEETDVIPGTTVKAPSTAVVVEASSLFGKQKTTFHEYLQAGVWRFAVTNPEEYADGKCPA